jgi:hypothetical protein
VNRKQAISLSRCEKLPGFSPDGREITSTGNRWCLDGGERFVSAVSQMNRENAQYPSYYQ